MIDQDRVPSPSHNRDSRYGSPEESDACRLLEDSYNYAHPILTEQWENSWIAENVVLGRRDIWSSVHSLSRSEQKKMFNFNICSPVVQLISGWQRRNRKSTICVPTSHEGQKGADIFTKCLFYLEKNMGFSRTLSHAFEQGALIKGIGFLYFYMDHSQDPVNGEIKCKYLDFHQTIPDPFFREPDMSDANFFWTRAYCTKERLETAYQNLPSFDITPPSRGRPDRFFYMPENYSSISKTLYSVDEYFYKSTRKSKFMINKETGDAKELAGSEEIQEKILETLKTIAGDKILIKKQVVPTIRRALFIGSRLIEDKERPLGLDCYPVVPVLGNFSPDAYNTSLKFKGIVHDMIDPQYMYNRLKISQYQELEAQQQGLKVKQGSLVTPDDALNQGPGNILVVSKEHDMGDIQKMPIEPPSPVIMEMTEILKKETYETGGASEELMGVSVDDKSGILTALKQSAGLTRNQKILDNLDFAQKTAGEIQIKLIQNFWSVSKVRSVTEKEPEEEFYNKLFRKYSAKATLGVMTDSQMQLEAQQLIHARELGIPISSERILRSLQIQDKDELIAEVEQSEQAGAQAEMVKSSMEMQQIAGDEKTKSAFAHAEEAKARERLSKSEKNIAEAEKTRVETDTEIAENMAKSNQDYGIPELPPPELF
jgi:hypothetical protein